MFTAISSGMKVKIIATLLLFIVSLSVGVTPALAEHNWLHNIGVEDGLLIPDECTRSEAPGTPSQCNLNSVFQLIVNFTQVLLALTGSVAILMFVFGGTMMIIGGTGKTDYITMGKDAIKAAVVGIAIMLGAWLVINFTILALTGEKIGTTAQLFNRDFNAKPSGSESSNTPSPVIPDGSLGPTN